VMHIVSEGKGGRCRRRPGRASVAAAAAARAAAAACEGGPRRAALGGGAHPHALRVYRVPAAQHRGGVHALKQELEADGAVLVHGALHTLVVALERHSVAGAAGVAVEVVVAPADAADAALVAVVGLLVEVVVKEAALEAGVGTKLDAACCAGSAHGLACVAQRTQHLRYRPAVQLVLLLPILRSATQRTRAPMRMGSLATLGRQRGLRRRHGGARPDVAASRQKSPSPSHTGPSPTGSSVSLALLWQCLHQNSSPQQGVMKRTRRR
jgi:hypothetical protein